MGLFPPAAMLLLGTPYSSVLLVLSLMNIIPLWIGVAHFAFTLIVVTVFIICLFRDANNYFFCITDRRIIRRSGPFGNKFVAYSLGNVGMVAVDGGIFESKGENASAKLTVTVKEHQLDTGRSAPQRLVVPSLYGAYDAYKVLGAAENRDGAIRIKTE